MVTSQPPSNVPQQHNKPISQIINPVMNADQTHAQTLRQGVGMVKPTTPAGKIRERKPAILKDPTTNKEVPLPNTTTTSVAKSLPPATKPSSTAQTLLQKVSEDGSSDKPSEAGANTVVITPGKSDIERQESQTEDEAPSEEKANASLVNGDVKESKPEDSVTKDIVDGKPEPSVVNNPEIEKPEDAVTVKVVDKKTESSTEVVVNSTANSSVDVDRGVEDAVQEDNMQENSLNQDVVNEDKPEDSVVDDVKDDKPEGLSNGDAAEEDSEKAQDKDSEPVLHYEPGQYNPVSKSGKKIYSREFLLEVCEKICKIDLSHKDSDDKDGKDSSRLSNAFSEKIDIFAPAYSSMNQRYAPTNRQNDAARRQSQHNYAGRSSAGQERQRKVITSVSLTQEVELKTTSNPWRPTKDIKEDAPTDVVETETLKKKFRSILNKLTPDNFQSLAKAVTDLNIDTEPKLGEVIDIVFAKALAEPGYCVLYGQMCSHLKKITAGTANFGNTLLRRCQQQFQADIYSGLNLLERRDKIENEEDTEAKKHLNEELYEDMYRCRMRSLGLIKFIGELYKIEMLNDKIMFDCVLRLLSDTSEESLECLCDLLVTVGEKLDRSSQKNTDKEKEKKASKSASKANAYQGGQKSAAAVVASGSTSSQHQQKVAEQQPTSITTLDQVFDQLHKIRKNKDLPLSVRIRFKLLDTCELREKDNWHSKTKDNNPKKIEEIREAHLEKLEQEKRQQNAMGPRRSQEGRRGLGHSGGSSNQISSLANESSGNRGSSTMHTSSSSHLLRDHSIGDNMKSNQNDIESQKEHQRKIETFKGISSNLFNRNEPLRPSSQITLRPTTGLRPYAASNKATPAATAAASSSSSTATKTTTATQSSASASDLSSSTNVSSHAGNK